MMISRVVCTAGLWKKKIDEEDYKNRIFHVRVKRPLEDGLQAELDSFRDIAGVRNRANFHVARWKV